jgi:Recombination endonuclease VII
MPRYQIFPDRKLTDKERNDRYIAAHPERRKASIRKYRTEHLTEHQVYMQRWNAANPDKKRASHLRSLYGITMADYQAMVEAQGGKCALCGKPHMALSSTGTPRPLHVDHDHATGRIRGLLCGSCNGRVGWLEGRGDAIRAYLEPRE